MMNLNANWLSGAVASCFGWDVKPAQPAPLATPAAVSSVTPVKHYQIANIGGGVRGGAFTWLAKRYTNAISVGTFEKNFSLAAVASATDGNSQTPHFGDIESNYSAEKAREVNAKVQMLIRYCEMYGYDKTFLHKGQKMLFGVGDAEVAFVLKRYEEVKAIFPYLEVFDKKRLKEIEPALVVDENGNERPENIVAVGVRSHYNTVDFGALTESYFENAQKEAGAEIGIHLNTEVTGLKRNGDIFEITTDQGLFTADALVVNAGAYSLLMAQEMGCGLDLSCVPVAGGFYMCTGQLVRGKVYRPQNPKLPYARFHADPDVAYDWKTRFGPTAIMLPILEYNRWARTLLDAVRSMRLDTTVLKHLGGMMKDSDIRRFMFKNALFHMPVIGKYFVVREARETTPGLRYDEIYRAKGFGGVRPQIFNKTTNQLMLGAASINTGKGDIYNMTASPGASSSVADAATDVRSIATYLGLNFDEEKFQAELGGIN